MTDLVADDARLLARAAAQLAALTHPDLAAVLAALPRTPGSTASVTELAETAGLDLRTVGKAVSRGRDAGVLAVTGDRVGLDPRGASAVVADLVARTPLGVALAQTPELQPLAPYGVLRGVPDGEGSERLLAVVAATLPAGELDEPAVTRALARFSDDPVALRRALVDDGLLWRTADGAQYRRAQPR